jgi:hypothetical protein
MKEVGIHPEEAGDIYMVQVKCSHLHCDEDLVERVILDDAMKVLNYHSG